MQPVVAVRDAAGLTVTGDNLTVVTMTVSAGATVVGTATRTAAHGVATFTDVGISGTAGTPYTLTFASVPVLTPATQSITPAGTASQLVLTTAAAGAASGAAFNTQPVVAVQDAGNNTVTGDNSTVVTMTVSAGATVVGTATRTAAHGVATFTDVGISGTAGTPYTLTFASVPVLTPATQSITPTAGQATRLLFAVQPTNASAGANISPTVVVHAVDAAGNIDPHYDWTVRLSITPLTGTLGALLNGGSVTDVTAVAGVATFPALSVDRAGTGYTLDTGYFTPGGYSLYLPTSNPFNITP
jgi:hypothetical protein